MKWNTFPLEVVFARQETQAILHLGFRRADGQPFQFQAGQFINLHFERDGEPAHRSYSVANAPGDSDVFEIAIPVSKPAWLVTNGNRRVVVQRKMLTNVSGSPLVSTNRGSGAPAFAVVTVLIGAKETEI